MKIGRQEFISGERTYVMGILNLTPNSFSDGGKFNDREHAMKQAAQMIEDGVDLIDVGGESTRPGHVQIGDEEEIRRVVPVIEELKRRFDVPISIDTYKSAVAEAALKAGADLLNDIWGFRYDERMAELAVEHDAAVCLMHNRKKAEYTDFMSDVISDLQESLTIAKRYGVKKEKIMLDPGVGFVKSYEQNLIVMNHLEDIVALGYPVLLGTSRKSMIGLALDLPVEEREEGTMATSVLGAMKGCEYVRVHDVKKNVRALKMTDTIMHAD